MNSPAEGRLPPLTMKLLSFLEAMKDLLPAIALERRIQQVRSLSSSGDVDASNALELQIAELCLDRIGAEASIRLALKAGASFRPGLTGHWGLAVVTSPNFGSALQVGAEYFPVSPYNFATKLVLGDGVVTLLGRDSRPLGRARDVIAAFDISSGWRFMTSLFGGKLPTLEIEIPLPATPSASELKKIFGVTPVFVRSTQTRIVFDASSMNARLPLSDPRLSAAHAEACELVMAGRTSGGPVASAVRAHLARKQFSNPTIGEVSRALALSERTLRRRLKAEGATFSELGQDVKKSLACELLTNTPLAITQVGERVGFNESSNFSIAFKRWTGSSPSEYRARNR